MKRTALIFASIAASALVLGCALRPPKTEVTADNFDLAPLVGEWRGDYASQGTGRNGDISFLLRAGEVSASGRIEMLAREPQAVVVPVDRPMVNGRLNVPARQVLTIHFVRKEGNRVIGMLDPYTDPECACRVTTTFEGVFLDSRTIAGTYNTLSTELAHHPTGGQWKVTRAKRL
jgi:hypothetical protein